MSIGLLTSSLRVLNTLKNNTADGYDRVSALVQSKLVLDSDQDYAYLKKKKSRLEMVLLSCAVCGIEFCYAAETAYVTPTLLQIGVPILYMTLIWGVSPMLGLLLVPVLGSLSDRCNLKLGRRRPFILLLSAGIILGLLLVPNGKSIGLKLGDVYDSPETDYVTISPAFNQTSEVTIANFSSYAIIDANHQTPNQTSGFRKASNNVHTWSIVFTILGVVLLDFSCDACQSPCRAYLLDVSIPEDHSTGLSTFTIMAGLGGSLGYVMGGINWEKTSFGESLGGHVTVVFTLVLIIYIICVSITVTSFKEVPLYKLAITKEDLQSSSKKVTGKKYKRFTNEDSFSEKEDFSCIPESTYGSLDAKGDPVEKSKSDVENSYIDTKHEPIAHAQNDIYASETESQDANKAMSNRLDFTRTPDGYTDRKNDKVTVDEFHKVDCSPLPAEVSLKTYLKSIVRMPKSLVILCVTNLFCWMSLVCYSLYFTDFVGQAVYGGDPGAPEGSAAHIAYDEGVRLGSFGMSLYSISCSVYSLNIERLVKKFGARNVYVGSQLVYTFGALAMATIRHPVTVVLLSPTSGIMYATLFTMPYLLVAHYHSNNTFGEGCDIQVRGLGTDIAIVSSMVFMAQFCLSTIMGSLVQAAQTTSVVMITAAVLSFCGAVSASQVLYLGL